MIYRKIPETDMNISEDKIRIIINRFVEKIEWDGTWANVHFRK